MTEHPYDRDCPCEDCAAALRAALQRHYATEPYTDFHVEKAMRLHEDERQERVKRAMASHGPWGGER